MRMAARLFLASAALGGLFGPAAAEELAASSLPLFAQNYPPKPQEPLRSGAEFMLAARFSRFREKASKAASGRSGFIGYYRCIRQ